MIMLVMEIIPVMVIMIVLVMVIIPLMVIMIMLMMLIISVMVIDVNDDDYDNVNDADYLSDGY